MESRSWHECFPSEGGFSHLSLLTGLFLSSPPPLVFIIVSGITNQVDDAVSKKLEKLNWKSNHPKGMANGLAESESRSVVSNSL